MFINFWYPAEWSERLGSEPLKLRMLGQEFALFRGEDGRAHCLANVCVHRGGSLAGGRIKGDCIECPYHGWRFDGAGRCQRIPSLGPQARIPARARVDSYPVQERYGIVFVFLGDLPEDERPPIMEIAEYGQPGWKATCESYSHAVDFRRSLENALDPAHNEFVHPTHGFSGEREDYSVPELRIEDRPWGSGFLTSYFAPPLKDERMRAASGREANAVIEAGTFHHGPSCLSTFIHPTPTHSIHQHAFKVPVDECSTRTFLVQTRNFLLEPQHDARFLERNAVVRNQDAVVLADIRPALNPEHNLRELLMPADHGVRRYREKLKEWEAQGWRIDTEAVHRAERHAVFAIPSPARRTDPKNWVLESVPLRPPAAPVVALSL